MNRRTLLSGFVATTAVIARKNAGAAATANALATYARMRGGKNGALSLWWYTGTVWGKPTDDIARPMFQVQGLTFQRLTLNPDGTLDQKMAGRGFYADTVTGQPLEAWLNPFTNKSHTPPHVKSLALQTVKANGELNVREPERIDTFVGRVGELTTNGDTIWMTENFLSKSKPDTKRNGAVSTTSSLSTFTAKIADVENDTLPFVPCTLNYQSLGSWPAWMEMGDQPGVLSWQTRGHKVRGPDNGPKELRDWIEAKHPGFLKDPGI